MSMCWGLNMKPNRKYTQTISKSFHVSGATIDEGEYAKLYLTADQTKYVIAHLDNKNHRQVPLDLNFCIGDKIMFQTSGDATISLIGYMHDGGESDDDDYEDEEYEAVAKALQKQKAGGKAAAKESDSEGDDDDEEDDDEDVDDSKLAAEYSSFLEDAESGEEEDEEDDDEDDDEEDDDEDDSEAEDVAPQAKKAKLNEKDKKSPKEQNGVAKKEANKQQQPQQQQQQPKSKKDKKAEKAVPAAKKEQPKGKDAKQPASSPDAERTVAGGVKVLDMVAGSGAEAKQGKRVSVYYIGRFKSNNKSFDSMQKGNGFKFALGAGEVIKGWDAGVVGMKVGGKRRITCPPHMAYGARGQPPTIPPNSTLVFDVELKGVH